MRFDSLHPISTAIDLPYAICFSFIYFTDIMNFISLVGIDSMKQDALLHFVSFILISYWIPFIYIIIYLLEFSRYVFRHWCATIERCLLSHPLTATLSTMRICVCDSTSMFSIRRILFAFYYSYTYRYSFHDKFSF